MSYYQRYEQKKMNLKHSNQRLAESLASHCFNITVIVNAKHCQNNGDISMLKFIISIGQQIEFVEAVTNLKVYKSI